MERASAEKEKDSSVEDGPFPEPWMHHQAMASLVVATAIYALAREVRSLRKAIAKDLR